MNKLILQIKSFVLTLTKMINVTQQKKTRFIAFNGHLKNAIGAFIE